MYVIERTVTGQLTDLIDVYTTREDAARMYCRSIRDERNVDRVAEQLDAGHTVYARAIDNRSTVAVRKVNRAEYATERLAVLRGRLDRVGPDMANADLVELWGAALELAITVGNMVNERNPEADRVVR